MRDSESRLVAWVGTALGLYARTKPIPFLLSSVFRLARFLFTVEPRDPTRISQARSLLVAVERVCAPRLGIQENIQLALESALLLVAVGQRRVAALQLRAAAGTLALVFLVLF